MIKTRRFGTGRLGLGAVSAMAVAAVLLPTEVTSTSAEPGEPAVRPVASASDDCGEPLVKVDGSTWECTFVDEFEGNSLNEEYWSARSTKESGFFTGITCYETGKKNVAVRRGALHLMARREPKPFVCESPTGDFETQYTGGWVATGGKWDQTYGRFEIRAKYPETRNDGVHGSFWMYPVEHTYGRWPNSGEIDIAEWWSTEPDLVLPALHYRGREFWYDAGWWCRVETPSEFHTYTLEWAEEEMRAFIDGQMCWSRVWDPDEPLVSPQPFDHAFKMVLLMGVGPESGHNAVTDETDLPGTYVVDYVRVWE